MKFINLKPLDIKRLKAYRKSILAKISGFEVCDCGSGGCNYRLNHSQSDPNYINLRTCLDRVNKELARKQAIERRAAAHPAEIPTVLEDRRRKAQNKKDNERMARFYSARQRFYAEREKVNEKQPVPGTSVTYHFEHKGLNAHVADGKFIYDTPEGAKKAAESMKKLPGFSNVKIV